MTQAQHTERKAKPPEEADRPAPRVQAGPAVVMSAHDTEILRSLADRIDPDDAGAHNNLGVVFYQKGLTEDAIAAFERALDLDPRLDVARRNAEIAYAETGDHGARIREIEVHLRANPDDESARDAVARMHLLGGDAAAAAGHWARLLERRPESAALHGRLAQAEAERGRANRALALLERAATLAPDDASVHVHTAEILVSRGELEEAEAAARTALSLDGESARAHALLGRVLERAGRTEEAALAFRQAEALDPAVLRPERHLSLERYRPTRGGRGAERSAMESAPGPFGGYARAAELRRSGDLDAAARQLERAVADGEDGVDARLALAELRLLQGSFEDALALYDRIVDARADSPKVWNERGVCLHRLGRVGPAIDAYRRAVALDHTYQLAWNNLGVARAQGGDADAGERALRQAAGSDAPAEVLRNLALFLLRAESAPEAVEVSRAAVERDSGSARGWCRLGSALFQADRPAEARDALLQAIELDAEDAEARYQLGFVLSTLGDFRGALRETKQALELEPTFPVPRYRLLIDVEYENGAVPAPEQDAPQRLAPGMAIPTFRFEPVGLDRTFLDIAPDPEPEEFRHLLKDAALALRRGELRRAADRASRAIALAPSHVDALSLHGTVFLERGLAGEALERFEAVLAVDPRDATAAVGRARALLELGRADDAAAAAERAEQAGGTGAAAVLGRALLSGGRAADAVEVFERAASVDPRPATLVGYGEALLAADREAEAEEVFRRVLERDPGVVAARGGLAAALSKAGRLGPAEAEYRETVATLPSYGPGVLGLADLLRGSDRTEEGLRVLIDFLVLDPTHVEGLARLGCWLAATGRYAQAAAALRRVLRLDPRHAAARAELARIPDSAES